MKKEEFEVSHSAILTSLSCGSKLQEPVLCKIKGPLGLTHVDLLNEVKRGCAVHAGKSYFSPQSSVVKDSRSKQRG